AEKELRRDHIQHTRRNFERLQTTVRTDKQAMEALEASVRNMENGSRSFFGSTPLSPRDAPVAAAGKESGDPGYNVMINSLWNAMGFEEKVTDAPTNRTRGLRGTDADTRWYRNVTKSPSSKENN
ncbi:hypothetical protein CYMTET_26941, partial [Cymbomonas tetramitiformis]